MKKAMSAFVLIGAFAATLSFGQAPGNPPNPGNGPNAGNPPNPAEIVQRRIARLTRLLDLTADQQTQATTIFTTAATTSATALTNLRTARQNLRTAVENNDSNTISQVAATIGTLTTQLTSAGALAEAAFYHLLTPDQQTKLNDLRSERPGMMGPGGMGPGPGGPGPQGFRRGH